MGVLLRWAPLILWVAAHLLLLLDCAGSTSHSLRYFLTAVSEPGQGLPQFISVGYVDDQQFVQYDSDTKELLPRIPWIRKVEKEDPQYWHRETQISQGAELTFRVNLQILRNRYNQSKGIHTYQLMYGCELGSEGRKGGYNQHAYDGRDFIAFDKDTLSWTAADTGAQATKRKLDPDLGQNQYKKHYLEEICIEWLQRYLDYGKETLLRTEAPEVKVTRKAGYDNLETLVCQVHGFYPKEIDANWVKDGEVWQEGTSRGLVAPNSDGTYYVLLSVKIDPEERDRFRCRVEHDSLEKPLDVAWEKEPVNLGLIVGAILGNVAAILLVSAIIIFFIRRKQSEKLAYKAASRSDQGSDSSSSVHHLRLEFCQATDSATCPEFCDWRNISLSPNPGSRCWWFRRRGRERASERQRKKDVAGIRGGKGGAVWGEMGVLFRWPPLILWAAAHLLLLDCAGVEKMSGNTRHQNASPLSMRGFLIRIHTIQMLFGCEWSPGRSNGGLWQYAYDGRDFIAFDKQTLTWTAADMGAQVTKRKWDADLAWNKYWKAYLEETCIEWLQRYLDYGKETLQRTEAPEVKVTRKAGYDNLETLVCQVHGFYPKEIDANWMKDGEVWYEGTSRGLVAPNSDGTYYVLLSVKIDPEERDRFRCRVEHDSLEKPLDVAWEKEPVSLGLIVGATLGVLTAIALVSLIIFFIRCK
ncbi:DLA class I histocompatibility antigen, A9/A9 alpha chain-like [Lacerta agilis]|uniref:DLA class I histocompatibility antigen, A9/A9 alpha chain-like n=1 Tax=Lacerta agilis TaxID=80427 RepID=UPI0014198275|nr:DLA class I histocompatibility antigen, A9/A9 alpha chain-like [Lacerta agilis]